MDLIAPLSSSSSSATPSLGPGFRFHPTDEELVRYYLRRKICGKPVRFDPISFVDIYKLEPWDLPGKSRLKSKDLEWYFFSGLDKKYGNSSRTNRATERGYWKTTGKDRPVHYRKKLVGMKKTLVYHSGRAPRGERSNWVMHEYRLVDEELEKAGIVQNACVLCRVFQKSGPGPKNGENYGAPLIEEEWEEEDESDMLPRGEYAEELPASDDTCADAYLDENDVDEILRAVNPSFISPLPLNSAFPDENHYAEDLIGDPQELLVGMNGSNDIQEQPADTTFCNMPVAYDTDEKSVKREYMGERSYSSESSKENPVPVNNSLDGFLDATDNSFIGDGAFIEANDFIQPVETDPSSFDMLNEYLFFDADDNFQFMGLDYSTMMESEVPSEPASFLPFKDETGSIKQATLEGNQQLEAHVNDITSSKQTQTEFGSDYQHPSIKQMSRMLGNIPAPPALASEFPTKGTTLHVNSASSSSVHVTAGVKIKNVRAMDRSSGKQGMLNIILSFGLSRGDDCSVDSQPATSLLSDKANSAIYWGWFYFMFMWGMFSFMSYKVGSYICAN